MTFRSRNKAPRIGTVALATALVLPIAVDAVQAQDLCAAIDHLIDQSRSQFVEVAGATPLAGAPLAEASSCAVTKMLKGAAYHCRWEFPYRAEAAYQTFDKSVHELEGCLGPRATQHSDQSVNHPDYYALRRFETAQADVTVSVKDKGAQSRTFVFLRVQGKAGN